MNNTPPKFKITERKPEYNAKGHITAYLCTLTVRGVFAGKFWVPTKSKITSQAIRSKKAQLAYILDLMPQEEYENLVKPKQVFF